MIQFRWGGRVYFNKYSNIITIYHHFITLSSYLLFHFYRQIQLPLPLPLCEGNKMSDILKIAVIGICAVIVGSVIGPTLLAKWYLAGVAVVILVSLQSKKELFGKWLIMAIVFAACILITGSPALAEPISPISYPPQSLQSGPPPRQAELPASSFEHYPDLCLGHWGCTLAASGGGLSDFAPIITEHHDVINASYVFSYNALMFVPTSAIPIDGFFTNSISLRVNVSTCELQQCWMHASFDTDYPLDFVRMRGLITANISDYTLTLWPSVRFTFPPRKENVQLTVHLVTCISRLKEENPCIHWQPPLPLFSTKSTNFNLHMSDKSDGSNYLSSSSLRFQVK